jgi:hypothetical protein
MTLSKIALLAVSVSLMGCQMTAGQLGTGTHIRPSSIDPNMLRLDDFERTVDEIHRYSYTR